MYANGLFGTGLRRFYIPFVPRVLLNDLQGKRERTGGGSLSPPVLPLVVEEKTPSL